VDLEVSGTQERTANIEEKKKKKKKKTPGIAIY